MNKRFLDKINNKENTKCKKTIASLNCTKEREKILLFSWVWSCTETDAFSMMGVEKHSS